MNPTTIDPATIQGIQASLAQYKSGGNGATGAAPPAAPVTPVPGMPPATPSPSTDPTVSGISASLANYKAGKNNGTYTPTTQPPKDPGALADFAKGLFGAPATILARPVQAAAELAGATSDQVDAATKKIPLFGGLIAPVDQNFSDVGKDVGRGIETVALGTGAPIAGGALFGVGNSLEQGNSLLSAQTAIDAALGGAGGKVLDWVGKPLLNGAGKVIGTITPQVIKDVAAGGAKAITTFAEDHQLLGGIASKPAAALAKGLQGVDTAIGGAVNKAGTALKEGVAGQYPGFNPTEHYQAINEHDILRPTTVNEPRFAKATRIYDNAASRGINLEKVATDNGIIHDQIAEGGRYNTTDVADNLREGNYQASEALARPAIEAAQAGVPHVSIQDVKQSILSHIDSTPNSQIDPADRAYMKAQVEKRYAPGSPADLAHPNGYNLTDLHDSRILGAKNGKFNPDGTHAENRRADLSRIEGSTFSDVFDKAAPSDLPINAFRQQLEKNFKLADYLDALNGKAVPQGITQKAVRLFGRAVGGVLGSKIGGFPGFLFGSRGGDMLFNAFETLPNPIKTHVLQSVKVKDPAIYGELLKYIGEQADARSARLALPAAGQSSAVAPPSPTLFSPPGGQATPNL